MGLHWECGVENVRALTDVSTPLATKGISAGVSIASVALKGGALRHKDGGPFARCIARGFHSPSGEVTPCSRTSTVRPAFLAVPARVRMGTSTSLGIAMTSANLSHAKVV
jgi:hypothetical protein